MNYLLDTCVLSEFTRRQPNQRVIDWLNTINEDQVFLSVITIGEIQHGIERLPGSHRKTELLVWLNDDLLQRFTGRVVDVDAQTMLLWGSLTARLETAGKPMSVMDALIAASAIQNNLILITCNTTDFLNSGVQLVNPFE
jgi:predicted nucleic acid-binding protein